MNFFPAFPTQRFKGHIRSPLPGDPYPPPSMDVFVEGGDTAQLKIRGFRVSYLYVSSFSEHSDLEVGWG